ncbi:MAG TPA: ATP-binding protein [Solirubrobacteraceae bacterium]|nr:ATP-binding protein [Solirubrobacteraceae bacterium]
MRYLRRLAPDGLRWRLAGWVALIVIAASALTFVFVYSDTGSELRAQIDGELAGEAGELAQAVASSPRRTPAGVSRRADGYIRSQPPRASSTLLFAIVPGAPTSTNRPELFTRALADNGETLAEQDAENRLAARLATVRNGYSTLQLPDVGELRLLERTVEVRGGPGVTVGVGEPLATVFHAQDSVARAFLLASLLALAGALVAAYLVGTRISRPLRRMAAVAARVDAGDLHPRIHDSSGEAAELRVLAESFNHMLDRLTDAFARQRAFVADASHELRTPLTVIRGQLEVLAAQASPPESEVRRVESLVLAEVARITRLVDDLLLLAKAEQTEFLRLREIDLGDYVRTLWEGMTVLASRHFELSPVPGGAIRADPDRLAQALRNLIANAIDHTAEPEGLVRLSVRAVAGGRIEFAVEDDGPGIPADQRELVFDRFHRTDAARDRASGGTGLGLAIVRAIADAHGGRAAAASSLQGGARVTLELPGFVAALPGSAGAADAADGASASHLPIEIIP